LDRKHKPGRDEPAATAPERAKVLVAGEVSRVSPVEVPLSTPESRSGGQELFWSGTNFLNSHKSGRLIKERHEFAHDSTSIDTNKRKKGANGILHRRDVAIQSMYILVGENEPEEEDIGGGGPPFRENAIARKMDCGSAQGLQCQPG